MEEVFHRFSHPFPTVMIDRIVEVEKDKRVRALKTVTANEFYLTGHFPGRPIVPGVMSLESMVQSALVLVDGSLTRGKVRSILGKVDRLKFRRPVVPGDRLEILVQLVGREEDLWKFKGKTQVGGETAAEADFALIITVREMGFEL